jgi:hypothetical protein
VIGWVANCSRLGRLLADIESCKMLLLCATYMQLITQ